MLLSATYTTMLAHYNRVNVYDPRYKPFLYLTQAVLLLCTIPAGMARFPLEERPPEALSSEEREVREAGAVLMIAGALLVALAVLMGWPFA